MQVIYSIEYILTFSTVVTVGMFDGVHKGHQEIIYFINQIAKNKNLSSCLITFEPHPRFILNKENDFKLLTLLDEKVKKLCLLNIHVLIIQKFNNSFQKLSAKDFVKNILVKRLKVNTLIIGHDHFFGKNREGNFSYLLHLSKEFNFDIIQIPAVEKDKTIISSTKIRDALLSGDLTIANKYLGFPYSISGVVIPGLGIGKKIGFPTANLDIPYGKLIPKKGVYFVKVIINSVYHFGMMNIGKCPTFNGKKNKIEVHIFNFSENIYGKYISIELKNYIREEIFFNSKETLIEQIQKDKELIQNSFLRKKFKFNL